MTVRPPGPSFLLIDVSSRKVQEGLGEQASIRFGSHERSDSDDAAIGQDGGAFFAYPPNLGHGEQKLCHARYVHFGVGDVVEGLGQRPEAVDVQAHVVDGS